MKREEGNLKSLNQVPSLTLVNLFGSYSSKEADGTRGAFILATYIDLLSAVGRLFFSVVGLEVVKVESWPSPVVNSISK